MRVRYSKNHWFFVKNGEIHPKSESKPENIWHKGPKFSEKYIVRNVLQEQKKQR